MASQDAKYIVSTMSTVIVVPVDGVNLKNPAEQKKIEAKIEAKVKELVNKLKASHEKFEDGDFGPKESDEFGAISFYGSALPAPAGSKYPAPESLKWERPLYDDSKFAESPVEEVTDDPDAEAEDDYEDEFGFHEEEEDNLWCRHGKLFLDGTASGDVIQGQLGDCWFLSALAVMGANESLLQTCFWKEDAFKEYGLYVLRFYKDCNIIFVIVDDRLPVKAKDGKLIFAGNKDPNELWVPLIEKAYAKLHGCYKALIGGYTHYGLADMTGFCPRLIVMREGYLGYSEKYTPNEIWSMLVLYKKWNSLMGCSIQSNPKEKQTVEAEAGHGLIMGHAYSLLSVGEIDVNKGNKAAADVKPKMVRLVKLRNPWGRGEWEGPFGDRSDERELHNAEIDRVFNSQERVQERAEVNFNDGTFFMTFEDWLQNYTSLFVAVNFPATWTGKRTQGQWSGDQGGNRDMGTWISNPKIKFRLEKDAANPGEEYRQVFVGLYIKDSRLTMGCDYYKDPLYATPLAFDIVTAEELKVGFKGSREFIPHSQRALSVKDKVKQPPYNFGTTQVDVFLKVDVDYFIVPSLYKRNQTGTFFLNVFADAPDFHLDGSMTVSDAQKPMIVGSKEDSKVELKMSVGQYYDRKEQLRERIVAEAKRLNLSTSQLEATFCDCKEKLTLSAFKRRVMDMGFMLTDFPDADLVVLDADNDGTISHKEFIDFFKEGLKFAEVGTVAPPPEPPVDDLLYKAVDLAGELTVTVNGARTLREATTWFNSAAKSEALVAGVAKADAAAGSKAEPTPVPKADITARRYIKYDPAEAQKLHKSVNAERRAALEALLTAPPKAAPPPMGKPVTGKPGLDFGATLNAPLTLENLNSHNTGGQDLLSPLKSVAPRAHPRGGHEGSAMTGMSVAKTEMLQKAGKDAGVKLHSDPGLQKAEVARTKFLGLLRTHQKNKNGAEEKEQTGILRKKTQHFDKITKRNILEDVETQYLLNYWPNGPPGTLVGDTEVAVRPATLFPSSPMPLKGMSMSFKLTGQDSPFGRTAGTTTPPVNAAAAFNKTGSTKSNLLALSLTTPTGPATAAPASAPAGGRYKSVTSDLWDYLIDCVVTISISRPKSALAEKQRAVLRSKSRRVSAEGMAIFDPCRTPIPAPSTKVAPARPVQGTVATPKTTRHTPGHASVTSALAKTKQQSTVLEAKDRLQKSEKDVGPMFEEVYRRLVRIPVTSNAELEGDRETSSASGNAVAAKSHAYLRSLFERFDKNVNGYISKDEFKMAMGEMNVEVSSEDCDIFFNRFKGERPGNIDWKEFIRFFDTHLAGTTSSTSSTDRAKSIVQVLMNIKSSLAGTAKKMTELKISTLETFLALQGKSAAPAPMIATFVPGKTEKVAEFVLPDNAIFQNIATSGAQVKTNVAVLQKLGVVVTEEEMARVSRIFQCKASLLMAFVLNPQDELDLYEILDIADNEVSKGLSQRTGTASSEADQTGSIGKLWSSLAPNLSTTVSFETITAYLTTMLLEANVFDDVVMHSPRAKEVPLGLYSKAAIRGIDAHILCRIIADTLLYSSWNRDTTPATAPSVPAGASSSKDAPAAGFELKSALSFSGLDAYVRNNRINFIERKLKYLMQLESNYSGAEIYMLVHVFFSVAQDEFVILALDPLSGDIFKLGCKEDLKHLPMGEKLVKLFMTTPKQEEFVNQKLKSTAVNYYNPWETPAEDAAVTEVVSRLRLVRSKTSSAASSLLLCEEPKFVSSLKTLLDSSATLPFFSILNELTLTFEVHDEKLTSQSSIRSFVFGHIRNYKPLCTFLEGVNSSLNVVLSTYNGGIRETFKWKELLSHLTNYRNPFFTVQLLPAFLEPEQYIYTPEENTAAFTGDDDVDESTPKLKSPVDYDGAPHPSWDASFKFKFQPPQLTNCKVLSTEVAKVKVVDKVKYAVIMARQGKRTEAGSKEKQPFKFLTVYDPRSATDYQCGVKPGCKLYDLLYPGKDGKFAPQVDIIPFMQSVGEAAELDKFIVGPAITPRLEINVYNECGRNQELLGSCEVSVSSVLSGSGISEKQRVCLTYKQELPNGRSIDASAGDIQMEMRFRGQMMIDAEKQAEENRLANAGKKALAGDVVEDEGARVAPAAAPGKAVAAAADGKLKEAAGKLEDLRTANDTLALEAKKLKDKLAATSAQMEEIKTTGASAAISAELQVVQDEKARLLAEKAKVEAEKAELAAQLAKVTEQSKKEIAALKEANEQALKKAQQEARNTAPAVDTKAAEDYKALQEAYEQLRVKLELAQDRPIGARAAPRVADPRMTESKLTESVTSLPALNHSASRTDVETHGVVHIEDETLLGTVRGILNEFQARHERKNAGGNALDSLQRLLNSYAKPDGTIIPKDLIVALNDVLITISMEQATKIGREVGMSQKNTILVSALMGYLGDEMHQLQLAKKRRATARPDAEGGVRTSLDDSRASAEAPRALRPARPASAQVRTSNEDAGSRPRVSQNNRQVLSATDGNVGRSRLQSVADNGTGPVAMAATVVVPTVTSRAAGAPAPAAAAAPATAPVVRPAPAPAPAVRAPPAVETHAGPESPSGEVDWSREPLPPNWECKLPKGTSRHVYVNHETKKTQWHHPLDTSRAHRRHRRPEEGNTEAEAAPAAVPAAASAPRGVAEASPRAGAAAVPVAAAQP